MTGAEAAPEVKRQGSAPGQLSHSAGNVLAACEMKYYFEKVARVGHDPDLDPDTYSLRFGNAVHYVMEMSLHDPDKYEKQLVLDAVLREGLEEEDVYKVYACCVSLYRVSKASGLRIIHCELQIQGAFTFGYIDAIGVDSRGRWWILDLKTTSWWKGLLPYQLRRDPQLSVYAAHVADVARELGLREEDFAGVIYRCVSKPKSKPRRNERLSAYAERVMWTPKQPGSGGCMTHQVIIPKSQMAPEEVLSEHRKLRDIAEAIRTGELEPSKLRRNYRACIDWNRPCEYWSKCYGVPYSECVKQSLVASDDAPIDVGTVEIENLERSPDMLNVKCVGTQIFNLNRVRIDVVVSMGAVEFQRPFYFDLAGEPDAEEINALIKKTFSEAKTEFWIHLADLAESKMYQSWAQKLNVAPVVPAAAKLKEEAPAAPAAKPEPQPEPKKVEAPATPEPQPEAKKAEAKKGSKKKAVEEKPYEKGNKEYITLLKETFASIHGADWASDPEKKQKLQEVANLLVEKQVIILRDGKVAPEFGEFIRAHTLPAAPAVDEEEEDLDDL